MPSRRSLILLCFVLLAASLGPATWASAAQDLSTVEASPNDCEFLAWGADDPRPRLGEISCGTLDVPENWSEPEGRRIEIGYAVLKATGSQPAADPIVFLAGGPGTSPMTRIEAWASVFAPLRQDRDIVIFDQRGTRLSSPLRCEAYSTMLGVDLPPDVMEAAGAAPVGPASDPADLDAEALLQGAREQFGAAAAACVEQIKATGVDLSQYNTFASANDVVALVKALGYDAYNLYGVSYGTRLALEVMRNHADSGLRSVVLDSTYPPEIKSYEEFPQEPHQVVIQLFADCARDAACNVAYPNLQVRFIDLLAQLRDEPIAASDGTTISDRDLIAVMQGLAGNLQAVPYVPAMIAELERGEDETYLGITSGSLFASSESAPAATPDEATPEPAATIAFSAPRQFVLDLQAQAATLPEYAADSGQLLSEIDLLARDRQTLRAYVEQVLSGASQDDARTNLLAALDAMSDAEVQSVFDVVVQEITLADVLTVGATVPQYYSVECNERIPFQSFANMVLNAQQLAIPELSLGIPELFVKVFAICESWPSGRAPEIEQQPVWSSVPTLILAGAYDNVTPVSWNKSAFKSLPNGVFVLAPMAGHGVITYSSCAQDVANAFIGNPGEDPDSSCFVDLRPAWILPA